MQLTAKAIVPSRREITVALTPVETAEFFEAALRRLAETVKIQGFRPGKAPMNLVRDQIDTEKLREEAYSLAVHEAWHQIAKQLAAGSLATGQKLGASGQEPIAPIEDPAVEIITFDEAKAAEFRFGFDVRPKVTIKDITAIKLTGIKKTPVTDEDVTEVLNSLAKGHAKTVVTLEPAGVGDKVEVSFDGYVKNVKQEKLSSKHFPIVLGEKSVIPGFAEELIGLKKGETKTFELTFPADHFDKTLAGEKVRFEATVDEVFDVQLSPLDDEFGKKFGHDTLSQLKSAIKVDLQKERDEEFFTQQKAKWLAEFEKKVSVELPESLIKAEVNRARNSWQEFLTSRNLQPAAWLTQRGLTLEQLEKDWRTAATASVTIGLGLAELAAAQNKSLTSNEDYQQFLDSLVKATNTTSK